MTFTRSFKVLLLSLILLNPNVMIAGEIVWQSTDGSKIHSLEPIGDSAYSMIVGEARTPVLFNELNGLITEYPAKDQAYEIVAPSVSSGPFALRRVGGTRFSVESLTDTALIWQMEDHTLLPNFGGGVPAVQFDSCGSCQTVLLQNLHTKRFDLYEIASGRRIFSMPLDADNRRYILAEHFFLGPDNIVWFVDVTSPPQLIRFDPDQTTSTSVILPLSDLWYTHVSPEGKYVALTFTDAQGFYQINIYDTQEMSLKYSLRDLESVNDLAFNSDSTMLAILGNRKVEFYTLRNEALRRLTQELPPQETGTKIAISESGLKYLVATEKGKLLRYRWNTSGIETPF